MVDPLFAWNFNWSFLIRFFTEVHMIIMIDQLLDSHHIWEGFVKSPPPPLFISKRMSILRAKMNCLETSIIFSKVNIPPSKLDVSLLRAIESPFCVINLKKLLLELNTYIIKPQNRFFESSIIKVLKMHTKKTIFSNFKRCNSYNPYIFESWLTHTF